MYSLPSTTRAIRSGTRPSAASVAWPTFIGDAVRAAGEPVWRCSSVAQAEGSGSKGLTVTQQVPWALPWEVSWHSGEGGTLFRSLTILYSVGP